MSRDIKFAIEEYYHLYSRGTDKQEIFRDAYDYERFIKFLYLANDTSPVKLRESPIEPFSLKKDVTLVDIGAYCLMPNHFHILVREHTEGGISKFMSKLLVSHSSFFNKKYKRSGTLFESRFKAKHVVSDQNLRYLFAYIHLNPVKLIEPKWKEGGIKNTEKIKDYLSKYTCSSHLDYLKNTGTGRKEAKIINKSAFPDYFERSDDFSSLINDCLNFSNLDL